jgi:deoxyribodipyrimidine photo-lyase
VEQRVRKLNQATARPGGQYVLYWLRYNRRATSNHALAFAVSTANRLGLPLLTFESLDPAVPDRYRTFALEGVAETAAALAKLGIGYLFHQGPAAGKLRELTAPAAAFVTDDFPETVAARFGLGIPEHLTIGGYAVDSSCIVPCAVIGQRVYAAYSLRPRIHKLLPQFLRAAPLVKAPGHRFSLSIPDGLPKPPHTGSEFRGGRAEAQKRLREFLKRRLSRYAADKNEPAAHATSDLSPYLHFGYISALEVALAVKEYAAEHKLIADEFLEELIVRRELAFNFARYSTQVDSLSALPEWARGTLKKHRKDRRDPVYTPEQFAAAATYDDLWNATQKELLLRGKIHGYYRMYWGKKILEWSHTPEEALGTMIGLHERYALDGRDPNTYGNILWCFGLHDRPWPERPIYGTVRSMVRSGMERKTDVQAYLREIEELTA